MAKKKKIIKKMAPKKVALKKPVKKTTVKKVAVKKSAQKPVKKVTKKVAPKKVIKPAQNQKSNSKNIDYAKAVTPLGERIVVRAVQAETMTPGGLFIPDTVDTKERYVKATVLAVGRGAKNKKGHVKLLDVKVGDTILFPAFASVRIYFNSEELHIVNESDVLGTV